MNGVLIVCIWGLCFNPSQIVTLKDYKSSGTHHCTINFSHGKYQSGTNSISVENQKCEHVANVLNDLVAK